MGVTVWLGIDTHRATLSATQKERSWHHLISPRLLTLWLLLIASRRPPY